MSVNLMFYGSVTIPDELCGGDENMAQKLFKNTLMAICGIYDEHWQDDLSKESRCVVWVNEEE